MTNEGILKPFDWRNPVALVLGFLSVFYTYMTMPWGITHEWEFMVFVSGVYWFISLLIFYVVYWLVHGQVHGLK